MQPFVNLLTATDQYFSVLHTQPYVILLIVIDQYFWYYMCNPIKLI